VYFGFEFGEAFNCHWYDSMPAPDSLILCDATLTILFHTVSFLLFLKRSKNYWSLPLTFCCRSFPFLVLYLVWIASCSRFAVCLFISVTVRPSVCLSVSIITVCHVCVSEISCVWLTTSSTSWPPQRQAQHSETHLETQTTTPNSMTSRPALLMTSPVNESRLKVLMSQQLQMP